MLGWILLGIATVAVGVVVIAGIIDRSCIREKMRENAMRKVLITEINNCTNTVRLEDLDSSETLEIRGDYVDSSLDEFDVITV